MVTSKQRVTAALEPRATERPVVALVTPNKPTVVLSQPGAPKPAAGAVVVETVEIEPGGKFHVSGQARAGRGAEALSQRQLCDVGNGRRGWTLCSHDQ